MVTKTEGRHAGHFIVGEDETEGLRSREIITVAEGQVLQAGAVIAKNASTGKYEAYDNDGTSDTNAAAGVLFDNVDATDGDVEAVAIVRDASVNLAELIFEDTEDTNDQAAAVADLLALGIVCR